MNSFVAFEKSVKLREIVMENIQLSEQLRSSFFAVPDFMNVGSSDLLHEAKESVLLSPGILCKNFTLSNDSRS